MLRWPMVVGALKICGLGGPLYLISRPRCCSGNESEGVLGTMTRVLLSMTGFYMLFLKSYVCIIMLKYLPL